MCVLLANFLSGLFGFGLLVGGMWQYFLDYHEKRRLSARPFSVISRAISDAFGHTDV